MSTPPIGKPPGAEKAPLISGSADSSEVRPDRFDMVVLNGVALEMVVVALGTFVAAVAEMGGVVSAKEVGEYIDQHKEILYWILGVNLACLGTEVARMAVRDQQAKRNNKRV